MTPADARDRDARRRGVPSRRTTPRCRRRPRPRPHNRDERASHRRGRHAEPPVHLRRVRHRVVEPLRPRRGADGGRTARPRVQPLVRLRRRRPRQDPPPAGHRPLRARELPRLPGSLRVERDVPQRVRRLHPHRCRPTRSSGVTGASTCCWSTTSSSSRARRRPTRSSSTPSTPSTRPAARSCCRATAGPTTPRPRGPVAHPVQDGPGHRHPAARPRDPARDPAQEGRTGRPPSSPTWCSSTSPPTSPTTSANSKGALTRVSAFTSLSNEPMSVELAERVLGDLLSDRQPRVITADRILEATSKMFGCRRSRNCCRAAAPGRWSSPARSRCTSAGS